MQHTRTPEANLHTQRRPWHATLRLRRLPICPNCAEPLTPLAITFVASVAFCTECATRSFFASLKAAQTLHHSYCSQHATHAHGLTFYTPLLPGPPRVAQLAELLGIAHIYAALPLTPTGDPIPHEVAFTWQRKDDLPVTQT